VDNDLGDHFSTSAREYKGESLRNVMRKFAVTQSFFLLFGKL